MSMFDRVTTQDHVESMIAGAREKAIFPVFFDKVRIYIFCGMSGMTG
jgi:hypothetical protein